MAGDRIESNAAADAPWHARLAALLTASGKHESAAGHYRRALRGLEEMASEDSPGDEAQQRKRRLQWQFELAATEAKRGRREDAIALYQEILQTNPNCVEAQVNLAAQLAIADVRRLEEALELCMRALTLRPDLAEAHYNRNMLLRRLGRQSEAVNIYWDCLVRDLGANSVKGSMPQELVRAVFPNDEGRVPRMDKLTCTGSDTSCNQTSQDDGVTVVCVKWGPKYGAEYVNRLFNSVMRHCGQVQVTFVCLTDNAEAIDLHENMKILPLDEGWRGWWNKCQLFSSSISAKFRALGHSRCMYLDLDTVIVGNLVDLLMWSPALGVLTLLKTDQMTNEQRPGGFNSSIMVWHIGSIEGVPPLHFIHTFLHTNFDAVSKYIYKFDHWLEMAHPEACFLDDVFPDQIVEYRSIDERAEGPPPNTAIVCFPLIPKPHKASASWVVQHWK
ncbi:hypothetical protein PHMEG_0003354 [Phytophthora megakarya]|uniref:Uncharacterized protein n=1 Tax=Phytophthora megakarya TaxID=4795 RepID=A0A225WYW7_9STRA|nr:hypothetical protein PHMEG_0003354 [Phytophthora megakarya]